MKNKMRDKLRSRAGASITFALLLFLVCAVLCSVILTAATAASGRMSGMAETDQRYYAVTSAAELLKNVLDGKSLKIEKITEGVRTETYDGGSVTASTVYEDDCVLKLDSVELDESYPSFTSIIEEAGYRYYLNNKADSESSATLTLQPPDGSGELAPLTVTILESVDQAGNISLTVDSGGEKSYKIELEFSASAIGPTSSETAGSSTTTAASATEYTIVTNVTKTETTTLTWKLTGIKANPDA